MSVGPSPSATSGRDLCRPYLATMAREEHSSRVRQYPKLVEEGRIERGDAAADIAAWDAIATLLETGACDASALEAQAGERSMPSAWWAVMEHAAARALASRSAAADSAPTDQGRAAKRDAVHGIHMRLTGWRELAAMRPASLAGRQAA